MGKHVFKMDVFGTFFKLEKGCKYILFMLCVIANLSEEYIDEKSGKTKRKSPVTKNEMMQEMIKRHMQNQVKFRYILADTWYSSAENMKFIAKRGKVFIFELKENRMVTSSEKNRNLSVFERLDHMTMSEEKPLKVWIKDLEFPVLLFKQVFKNKDGSCGQRFLVTNDLTLSDEQFRTLYKKRWSVEEYHKSLKQNASIGSSPAHNARTQSNHIFSAIYAYTKLEKLKRVTKTNHFALKTKLYLASMKTALITFQDLWDNTQNMAFA